MIACKQKVGKMEPVGQQSEQLVANQKSENTDGAIVVGGSARAQMRQNPRAEDFSHVGKAANIGIGQNFVVVVVDKAVLQSVEVRKDMASKRAEPRACTSRNTVHVSGRAGSLGGWPRHQLRHWPPPLYAAHGGRLGSQGNRSAQLAGIGSEIGYITQAAEEPIGQEQKDSGARINPATTSIR